MNDSQIRYFLALYEARNAHRASHSIPLSRQGLLKALNSLEAELGVELFDDKTLPVCTPNRYGNTFYSFASQRESSSRELKREFKRIEMNEHNVVKFVAAIGTIGLFGLGLIKEFESSHPNARIVYDELPDFRCDQELLDGSFSLGLTVHPYHPELETREIYQTERSLWVSTKDPLAQRRLVHLENLEGYHVGVVGQSFKNHPALVTACKIQGVTLSSVDSFTEMTQLYRYAMTPGRVSFTAPSVAELFSELFLGCDEPVIGISFEGLPWKLGISWVKTHELSELEQDFVSHCIAYAKRIES